MGATSYKRASRPIAVPGNDRTSWRNFLFWCIAKRAPEAINELARDIYPFFKTAFWAPSSSDGWSDKNRVAQIAQAWHTADSRSSVWAVYDEVRAPLLRWYKTRNLEEEWVLIEVLNTFKLWANELQDFNWAFGWVVEEDQFIPQFGFRRGGRFFHDHSIDVVRAAARGNKSALNEIEKIRATRREALISWRPSHSKPDGNDVIRFIQNRGLGGTKIDFNSLAREVMEWRAGEARTPPAAAESSHKPVQLEDFELLALHRCLRISHEGLRSMPDEVWSGLSKSQIKRRLAAANSRVGLTPLDPGFKPELHQRRPAPK